MGDESFVTNSQKNFGIAIFEVKTERGLTPITREECYSTIIIVIIWSAKKR